MGQRQGPNGLSPPGPCGSRKYLSKSALYRVQRTRPFAAGSPFSGRWPRGLGLPERLSPPLFFDGVWKDKHLVLPDPNTCRCGRSVRHCTGCAGESIPFSRRRGEAACSPRPGAPASDAPPSSGAAKRFCLCKTAHIVRRALLPNSNKGAVRLYCWGPATGCSPMGMTLI